MRPVYVVTDNALGWDCVVGVYDDYELAQRVAKQRGESCVVLDSYLETKEENYIEDEDGHSIEDIHDLLKERKGND